VAVRIDLLDTRIDVCTLEVLTLLVDNFDWGDLRTDVLASVLSSDILGKVRPVHPLQLKALFAAHLAKAQRTDCPIPTPSFSLFLALRSLCVPG
jgi:hypothetical protein